MLLVAASGTPAAISRAKSKRFLGVRLLGCSLSIAFGEDSARSGGGGRSASAGCGGAGPGGSDRGIDADNGVKNERFVVTAVCAVGSRGGGGGGVSGDLGSGAATILVNLGTAGGGDAAGSVCGGAGDACELFDGGAALSRLARPLSAA